MILDNDVTVEYYTYMYREQANSVTYFKEASLHKIDSKDLIEDDWRMKFFLDDKG